MVHEKVAHEKVVHCEKQHARRVDWRPKETDYQIRSRSYLLWQALLCDDMKILPKVRGRDICRLQHSRAVGLNLPDRRVKSK